MSKSVESQVLDYLASSPTASLSEITASFEKPRSEAFVDGVIADLIERGEVSRKDITSPSGDSIGADGIVIEWLRAPQPIEPELVRDLWQIPPTIPALVEAGAWTSESGPARGIYMEKSPPYRCSWTATYTAPGFQTVLDLLGGTDLSQTQIYHEGVDVLSMGLAHAFVMELGRLLAEPRPWNQTHEEAVRRVLNDLRPSYPQYQPHWLMRPWQVDGQMKYTLPFRVYGKPSFRRSWIPFDIEHAWAQPR